MPVGSEIFDYPVMLRLAGRRCLVVGGGPVAARKARGLLAVGARVTVVAPEVVEAIVELAVDRPVPGPSASGSPSSLGSLEVHARPYRAGEGAGYDLVVTATGRVDIDGLVVSDADAANVLVDSADRRSPGSIQLPAVLRQGPVTISVSTGGAAPGLAAWLRGRIASALPPDLATLVRLVDEVRGAMQEDGRPTGSVDWVGILDGQVAPLVEAGRIDAARSLLFAICLPPGG